MFNTGYPFVTGHERETGKTVRYHPEDDDGPGIVVPRPLRHEVGHIYGIFINTDAGGLMGSGVQSVLSDREKNMFGVLYSLPHGAQVSGDGTWQLLTPGP